MTLTLTYTLIHQVLESHFKITTSKTIPHRNVVPLAQYVRSVHLKLVDSESWHRMGAQALYIIGETAIAKPENTPVIPKEGEIYSLARA